MSNSLKAMLGCFVAGALVGVSLCDAEASIAAPMTSRIPNIGVMITVVAGAAQVKHLGG